MTSIAELNRLGPTALAEALSGPPEAVAGFLADAAKAGIPEAQLSYGQMLLDGQGVDRNQATALRWFGQAARAGNAMAMNMVGRCCELGWGTAVDFALAAQWYRAAADRGLDWGLYNLATFLTLGRGVSEDRAAALELFRKAASQGHAKSITMVGSFYEDGWAVAADREMAAIHYAQAAEAGDFRGMFNHARMLIDAGQIQEAADWLGKLPHCSTAAFLTQVVAWLAARPEPRLRALGAKLVR